MHNYTDDELDECRAELKNCEKRYNILLKMLKKQSKLSLIDISELDKKLRKTEKIKEITLTKSLTAKEVTDETIKFLRKQIKKGDS